MKIYGKRGGEKKKLLQKNRRGTLSSLFSLLSSLFSLPFLSSLLFSARIERDRFYPL